MLYDIERRVWYNQTTYGEAFISQPPVRTRFCSVLVNDQKRNVWE